MMPRVQGVRTARKLLVGLGIGLASITICSVLALLNLSQLNGVVRHLAFDPVPGSAAIASMARDFNQYRVVEGSDRSALESQAASLTRKAADIERDLNAYDVTITQHDDRQRFTELVALWSGYRVLQGEMALHGEPPAPRSAALRLRREETADQINALLTTMIDWNRLEGVHSIASADSATRAASATVLSMLVAALVLSALALYFNRTVERPMSALAETARSVALGNLDVRAAVDGPLEVALVAHELNEMLEARARADANARLLSAALEESRAQLQRLTAALLQGREEERTRVAREIHDVLGQTLTAFKMDIGWIGRRLTDDAPALRAKLASMVTLIDDAVVVVRRMASDLRPGILDDLGLAPALEWQAQEFEQRTGIHCGLRATVGYAVIDPVVSTAMFRIFQEALTNVVRHSCASHVMATLDHLGTDLVLEVRDDGVGITREDASATRSIGLVGMRERAQLIGGTFTIAGSAGGGTTVRVQIPLREAVST